MSPTSSAGLASPQERAAALLRRLRLPNPMQASSGLWYYVTEMTADYGNVRPYGPGHIFLQPGWTPEEAMEPRSVLAPNSAGIACLVPQHYFYSATSMPYDDLKVGALLLLHNDERSAVVTANWFCRHNFYRCPTGREHLRKAFPGVRL